jgi:hypothetical protein
MRESTQSTLWMVVQWEDEKKINDIWYFTSAFWIEPFISKKEKPNTEPKDHHNFYKPKQP